jgi:hypothetical protein
MSRKLTPGQYADLKGAIIDSRVSLSLPLLVERSTTPANASPTQASVAGYAKGCMWVNSTGTAGSIVFFNKGTVTTSDWLNIV